MATILSRPVFRASVAAIVLFNVAALLARSALETELVAAGLSRAVSKDLSFLVVPPLLALLMFPYLQSNWPALRSLFRRVDLNWRLIGLSILLGLTLRITWWAGTTIALRLGLTGSADATSAAGPLIGFDCPAPPVLLLSLVVMAVLIPPIEETISRGFVLHLLLPGGKMRAIVVSAALFAAMHLPSTWPIAFVIGLFLAVQTLNGRTLWASVVTHATYNAAAVLDWDCFRVVWQPAPGDPLLLQLAAAAVPLFFAGLTVAVLIVRHRPAGA